MSRLLRFAVHLLFTLWAVGSLVFLALHLIPGDLVSVMLGEGATAADRAALRAQLGLDLPLWQQYVNYFSGLLHGDLGQSLLLKRPVAELILERFPYTLELALLALALAVLISLPLGVAAAVHAGRWIDQLAMGVSLLGVAVPNFWLGPMLILLFSLWLGWLPVSGADQPWAWVLPAVTLGTALAAILTRMVRASLLEVLHEDFLRTAAAKGLGRQRQLWRHALPNALLPVVTVLGLQLGTLLGGAVITEVVFDWPGLGQLLIESIQRRDYPVVQGVMLVVTAAYVIVNGLTDLLYGWLDPRVRLT
ncbi:ABC transporter permease [Sulfurivirga sp.]|uniref:ABC transporter permease n=1 Tax=Sulfurivirga sp. TaxID=2614236 RepID=UPI0025E74745|nr:ABC transporter permease [Sulfurivirga sp.]